METKRNSTLALWLPTIWYAIAASRAVGQWLNLLGYEVTTGVDYLEGSPIDRVVFSTLILLGVVILFRRRIDWRKIARGNASILTLFAYMLFSALWSDFSEVSIKRWIRAGGDLVMVLVVLTEPNPVEAISALLRRCFYLHLPLSIILIKYFRTIGVGWTDTGAEMWMGVTTHKNVLGELCMVSGVFFLWNMTRKRMNKSTIIDVLYLFMTLWLLNGSDTSRSNTGLFMFAAGAAMLLYASFAKANPRHIRRHLLKGAFLIALLYLILQASAGVATGKSPLSFIIETSGRDSTLTGRTDLWNDVFDIANRHPIFGVGYGSFWIGDKANNLWERHIWKPSSAHNGYLDVYVELGVVGLFLLLLIIIISFRNIATTFELDFEYGRLRLALFFAILLHNITESSFLRGASNLWFIFLLVAVTVPGISTGAQEIKSNAHTSP